MEISDILKGPEAKLYHILENRENRVMKQMELSEKFRKPVVSFSLNIAGPIKRFSLADKAYEIGKKELTELFNARNWTVLFFHESASLCGLECMWVIDESPLNIKAQTSLIEEIHPLGRLFDIDIILENGEKVSRSELGLIERCCIVCGKKGMGCARSRSHEIEEVQWATVKILKGFFDGEFTTMLSQMAVKALLYEVSISPKPGLVDRISNGAHGDMDFFSFLNSSCALIDYFSEISEITIKFSHVKPNELLKLLSFSGIKAEKKMYKYTKNINTHKGAIYSLGILCAAYSYAYANSLDMNSEGIFRICAGIAKPSLLNIDKSENSTAGEKIYKLHGISGARGEAAGGFRVVKDIGLPVYKRYLSEGFSYNDAGVIALLHIIGNMEDTNAIKRAGLKQAAVSRERIKSAAEELSPEELIDFAQKLDKEFISDNLSHGGAADMLALTLAVLFIEEWLDSDLF